MNIVLVFGNQTTNHTITLASTMQTRHVTSHTKAPKA